MKISGTLILICLLGATLATADGKRSKLHEQTSFSAEDESVERPVQMPDSLKVFLARDPVVASVLEDQKLRAQDLPVSWFNIAEIHLNSAAGSDLIVIAGPPVAGANTTFFWIFRGKGKNPDPILKVQAHTLHVRRALWKGMREIEVYSVTLQRPNQIIYRFDGERYTRYKTRSEKIN